jgi:hypothetical protein
MALSSAGEVIAALEAGQDESVLGTFETSELDFKGAPYRLAEEREQWELAKDVAALANVGHGALVIGVQTTKDPSRDEDVASKVAPFDPVLLDLKRCRDLVQRDVYPRVEGLEFLTIDRLDNKVLVVIQIAEQDPDRGPFLLRRVVARDGERALHAFALPVRVGGHTAYEEVGLVHRDIADGRRARKVGPHVRESPSSPPEPSSGVVKDQVEAAERLMGWSELPVYWLAASPPITDGRIENFYGDDGVFGAIRNPKQLRGNVGFGLTYGFNVDVREDEILSVDSDRRVLKVERSGFALAGAAGTPEFLAWAQDNVSPPRSTLGLNPIVLVEYTLEFCLFVHRELVPLLGPGTWRLAAAERGFKERGRPLALSPGHWGNQIFPPTGQPARVDTNSHVVDCMDPQADAFKLLVGVYEVFGLGPDDIPFSRDGRVEPSLIQAVR